MESSVKRRHWLWISLILLLALALRLTGLWWGQGYFYFGQGDGLAAYSVAVDYAKGDPRSQYIGQPNYNAHSKLPGPLWTLFCFLGLKLGHTITGVIVATILLNVAAVYLTFLLANRTLGPPASLWAVLFAATMPSPVFYSVGVYNPEVMPFLGVWLYLVLWQVVRQEHSRHAFWLGLLLLMMPQFHMSGLALWPTVAIVLALSPVRLSVPWLLGGLLAGVLLYVPYLRGELAHGWQNTRGMLSGGSGFSWEGFKALTTPFNLLINWVPQWTRSSSFEEYRALGRACFGWFGLCLAVNALSVVLAAFLAVGAFQQIRSAVAGFWRAPRAAFARDPGILFLAIILVVPLLSGIVVGQPFHARYALVFLPPLLALAGAGAARWVGSDDTSGLVHQNPKSEGRNPKETRSSKAEIRTCESALRSSAFGFGNAGSFSNRALKRARFSGRVFVITAAITTCANVWFMPAYYWNQGVQIAQGAVFVPSFRQLETVYRNLKEKAGPNRLVRVDDAAYLSSLSRKQEVQRDAALIRLYVAIREKELASMSDGSAEPVVYKLCQADAVSSEDKAVAYRAHGIALIADGHAP
jgi:hypothetical protein